MASPARIASRSLRRSQHRSNGVSMRGTWRHGAVRPVALAVWLAINATAVSAWSAGAAVTAKSLTMPAATALPKPSNGVLIDASAIAQGSTAKLNGTNQADLQINQTGQKVLYNWSSFDIGKSASVTYMMPNADASALNRISNSTAPSQIYGSLNAYYLDAATNKLVTGGELYLINNNGILFGSSAQVNVGGLIASALNVTDADFKSGLNNSINGGQPTFSIKDPVTGATIVTYDPAISFVRVDAGANITTSSGGRVFLVGSKVDNAGSISTPNGQTVLAAGSDVYLSTPSATASPLYMSEANPNVPTVKGLLVEVNSNRLAGEAATNTGSIYTPTGNTTIVGWAVNQNGRINATTSVTQNGSVFLQARSKVTIANINNGTTYTKQATQGGQLVLGSGSTISITPDQSTDASGQTPTVSATSQFTASRIELSGQTIDFQSNASIKAPAAVVNVRAENTPKYDPSALLEAGNATGSARITVGAGASIDVSGTTDTTVSAARNFVTTALLGASDLKDAPLQKDGPLYRSKLTFDIRQGSPILGDTSAYVNAVQKSAGELMSVGGAVSLTATGAVVTHQDSLINVSGGQVNYTAASVNPSILVAQNGQSYTLNNAPADVVYVGIAGQGDTTQTRFGTVVSPGVGGLGHLESGYVNGQSAGKLSVVAPIAVLDGKMAAATVKGLRQKAGLDPLAALGQLTIGTVNNGTTQTPNLFGSDTFLSAVLSDFRVTRDKASLGDDFWSNTASAATPTEGRVSASAVNASGFGNLTIGSNGQVVVDDGANLELPQLASVTIRAAGEKGITLGGSIHSSGGSVTVQAVELKPASARVNGQSTPVGTLTLKSGATIDVSGNWVNQRLDGTQVASAVAGGAVTLTSGHGLVLQDGSQIDVSGGATMSTAAVVSGTNAGSINLVSNTSAYNSAAKLDPVHIGASLLGYGMSKGGTLNIKAGSVDLLNSTGTPSNLSDGAASGSLIVGADFLTQGGFQNFAIDGQRSLTVQSGTTLKPRVANWLATASARDLASGSKVSRGMEVAQLPDGQRAAANLALSASGTSKDPALGVLTMAKNTQILGDPKAKLALSAGYAMDIDGTLKAAGGQISMLLNTSAGTPASTPGMLHLGPDSVVDVSGTTVYQPYTGALQLGTVLDGGSITLGVTKGISGTSPLLVDQGTVLRADGAVGVLDVPRALGALGPAYTRQSVASNGGDVLVQVGQSGASLQGQVSAAAGDATASGGLFTLNMVDDTTGKIRLQQDALRGTTKVTNGEVTLSTAALQAGGFADVSLRSPQEINFASSLNWLVPRHLTLDAPLISATGSAIASLRANSTLLMGSSLNTGVSASLMGSGATDQGQLSLSGRFVELFGQQATKGIKTLTAQSDTELRLLGVSDGTAAANVGALPGTLMTHADVNLKAQQVVAATATNYVLDAKGAKVTISGGDRTAAVPLSAGSRLTINAAQIEQNGVLRAPFGSITLNASDALTMGEGLTSVSGNGLVVPYGSTIGGGGSLYYMGVTPVSAPVEKTVMLNANGKAITMSPQATIDLSGGGSTVAYEFIPGPGGSKDVFAGSLNGAFAVVPTEKSVAPTDAAILTAGKLSQANTKGNLLALGNTITFGSNGALPAGTYAILPARYALLPGAFLVKPSSSTPSLVSPNYSQQLTDGSYVVGATLGAAGSQVSNTPSTGFIVMPSDVARRYSEVMSTSTDSFFASNAAKAGVAAPGLASDAGRLSVVANQLLLGGSVLFGHDSSSRGGQLDVASSNIHVGDGSMANALNVTYDQLNNTGAESVVLGGVRQATAADGTTGVNVVASNVVVDASLDAQGHKKTVQVGDLTLVATQAVSLNDGAQIASSGSTASAKSLTVAGNGALVRVSRDASASTTRNLTSLTSTQIGAAGDLKIGQQVLLTGGAIVAEATHNTQIADGGGNGVTFQAQRMMLGARHMAAGAVPSSASTGADAPLVLSDALLAQFNLAQDLTLRSFSGLDLYKGAALGSSQTRTLTIDTPNIRVMGADTSAAIQAGAVQLRNTTGVAAAPSSFDFGTLTVSATAQAGGSGHITLGGGNVAISGAATTQLNAAGSVVLSGTGGLSTAGDLSMAAGSLTAQQGASSTLQSSSWITLDHPAAANAAAALATPGAGAQLNMSAYAINQLGNIALPSGALTLNSRYDLNFGATSTTDLSGLKQTIDGVGLSSMGGTLTASSKLTDITQSAGAVIDVSAGLGAGTAGTMSFTAPLGNVRLQGRLVATSSSKQSGGSLSIDSGKSVDLQALANTIAAEQSAVLSNLSQSISVRARMKGQGLNLGAVSQVTGQAPSNTLTAENISLSSDLGDVSVSGALHAASQSGGSINLSAGGNVTIQKGADLQAHADAGGLSVQTTGGMINLSSSGKARSDGTLGTVQLLGGTLDTSGLSGGQNGRVAVRATADALLADTSSVDATLKGVGALNVEAVQVLRPVADPQTAIASVEQVSDQAVAYVADLFASETGLSKADRIAQRMVGAHSALKPLVMVRAGVEVQSTGNMALNSDLNLVSWRAGPTDASGSAAPVNLTLRAAGNLNILGSISDGFVSGSSGDPTTVSPVDLIQPGLGGSIRLIGGADIKSGNVMTTKLAGSAGDVVIGNTLDGSTPADVLVRTTTGDIQIAASRDINLLNPHAVVYTSGLWSDSRDLANIDKYAAVVPDAASPFMTGGGSVNVSAGRDVLAQTDLSQPDSPSSYATDWWWRSNKANSGVINWWNRYDLFQQGFATFGGGNVAVRAGRDAWNVGVSAAAGGYQDSTGTHTYGGGSVNLQAARDIVGGSTFAADDTDVMAGRNITSATSSDSSVYPTRASAPSKLVVLYGNGQTKVMARNSLAVGAVTQAGLMSAITNFRPESNFSLLGMSPNARIELASIAGNLTSTPAAWSRWDLSTNDNGDTILSGVKASADSIPTLSPATTSIEAGQGSIAIAPDLLQFSTVASLADGSTGAQSLNLSILGRDDVTVGNVTQFGTDTRLAGPLAFGGKAANFQSASPLTGSVDRQPVRLVSTDGNLGYSTVQLTQAARLIAGRDIVAHDSSRLVIQHQNNTELSLIQAGRDWSLSTSAPMFGVEVNGPGDLVVATGRNLDLHQTYGIQAFGNRNVGALPSGSVRITVLPGVSMDKGDITSASAAFFELLGGSGVGDFAPDLYAQLTAADLTQALPANSAAAQAFSALSVDEQISRAHALVGDAVYQQRVLSFMQHREDPGLTLPQALDQFNNLSSTDKAPLAGLLLTTAWSAKVPKEVQVATAMAMAASRKDPYTDKLVNFMKDRTGVVLSPANAVLQFAQMPAEVQALLSTQVLISEMNAAVSKAASLTGAAKTAAYVSAYNALDTVFPSAAAQIGNLEMGASRIETMQGSEINVFAPAGGVNVGQLTANANAAGNLGLITASSGNLAVVARDNVLVNQSRIFTVGKGDELIWSSSGSVDAGRGAKTVTAQASPVYYLDAQGKLQVDVTSAISGSGIAASGVARIAAPKGEINAGDAGISATGGLELAATLVRGADNISSPSITGAPPPAPVNTALAAPIPNQPTAAGSKDASDDNDSKAKKRKKRNILLDFLGFGSGSDS